MEYKIQLLGLRTYFDKTKQKEVIKHAFHKENWNAPSVVNLFANIVEYLSLVPSEEHFNLYYTACNCIPSDKPRLFARQEIIPFDIDGIDVTSVDKYIEAVRDVLVISPGETGIVFSGNGLQLIVGLKEAFTDENYFNEMRPYYNECCNKINKALKELHLPGNADTAVWSSARLLRLPNTKNIKKDKGEKWARLINSVIVPRDYDLRIASGMPVISNKDQITISELKLMPAPDAPDVIIEGCNYLKWCRDNPKDISEPDWYAMLSITARLEDGVELSHALSSGHPNYTRAETDEKIAQSLRNSGPRTCDWISDKFDGCAGCKYRSLVTSPIQIKGANYIATAKTRFHSVVLDKSGLPKPGSPKYEDLRKYFESKYKYVVTEYNWVYVWKKTHWVMMPDTTIEAFGHEAFGELSNGSKISEFLGYIHRTNKVENVFFYRDRGMMNFKNGVLDLSTKEFQPHSPVFGFNSVLPYDYDPEAKCPTFDRFMKDVTCERDELEKVLLEYMGFCFSYMTYKWHKCLILTGEGSNGKSTFLQVMKELAGTEAYSTLFLNDLQVETKRFLMVGKLFNVAEETPKKGLGDSSIFKVLTSGGAFDVKQLYKQPELIKENRTKLIMACNELPTNIDPTTGFFRRLMIVPFDAVFTERNVDYDIMSKLKLELPGILNRVIKGYDRLVAQDRFTVSKVVQVMVEEYRHGSDTVAEWFFECVEECDDSFFVPCQDFYAHYLQWCDKLRIRYYKSRHQFSKRIGALTKKVSTVRKHDKQATRGFMGLIIREGNF